MSKQQPAADNNTRQRVLRSAVSLFAAKGFNATGIRDLAAGASLTTSTLYHYMTNKDDLLVEIMRSTILPLSDAAERILHEVEDPAEALCAILEHHVWVHATDRLATLVADTELRSLTGERLKRMLEVRDSYEGYWRRAVERGVAEGIFEATTPQLAARALLQMATGVSHWFSPSGTMSLEQLCGAYSDGALGFLRARREDGTMVRRSDLTLASPPQYLPLNVDQ